MKTRFNRIFCTAMITAQLASAAALGAENEPRGLKDTEFGQGLIHLSQAVGRAYDDFADSVSSAAKDSKAAAVVVGKDSMNCGLAGGQIVAAAFLMTYEGSPLIGSLSIKSFEKTMTALWGKNGDEDLLKVSLLFFGAPIYGSAAGLAAVTLPGKMVTNSAVALQQFRPHGAKDAAYDIAAGTMGGGLDYLGDLLWQGASHVWNGRSTHQWGLSDRGFALFDKFAPIVHNRDMSCIQKVEAIRADIKAAIAQSKNTAASHEAKIADGDFSEGKSAMSSTDASQQGKTVKKAGSSAI